MEDTDRLIRHGRHLLKMARQMGWPDDGGEGPFEFVVRRSRELAMIDALDGHWHLDWVREQLAEGHLNR